MRDNLLGGARLLFCGAFLAACPSVVNPATTMAQSARPEGAGADLERRFRSEYPVAVGRLEAAIKDVRGHARLRRRKLQGHTDDSIVIEFYKTGDRLRYHYRYEEETQRAAMGRVPSEAAVLVTPGVSAIVRNPSTDLAWAERIESSPSDEMGIQIKMQLWRFLGGVPSGLNAVSP